MVTRSKLPSEDGFVISNESEKLHSGRGLLVSKVTAQQKLTKEEARMRDGESHMKMQIFYFTPPLKWRSSVSLKKSPFFSVLAWLHFIVFAASRHLQRNAPALQLFFTVIRVSLTAVSRPGPDEYAWDTLLRSNWTADSQMLWNCGTCTFLKCTKTMRSLTTRAPLSTIKDLMILSDVLLYFSYQRINALHSAGVGGV